MGRHGHPRHTSAPHSGKAVGGSTAHTITWHRSTQQTRMSPEEMHEVTNTDSVIRAHVNGACYGHTADDKIADGRLDVAACYKVPEHRLGGFGVANVS